VSVKRISLLSAVTLMVGALFLCGRQDQIRQQDIVGTWSLGRMMRGSDGPVASGRAVRFLANGRVTLDSAWPYPSTEASSIVWETDRLGDHNAIVVKEAAKHGHGRIVLELFVHRVKGQWVLSDCNGELGADCLLLVR
jgi:hypothetical protein